MLLYHKKRFKSKVGMLMVQVQQRQYIPFIKMAMTKGKLWWYVIAVARKGTTVQIVISRAEKCHVCGKVGHLKNICKAPKSQHIDKSRQKKNSRLSDNRVHMIDNEVVFNVGTGNILKEVNINGTMLTMIFDTGAEISLVNRKTFDDIARNSMQAVHLKPSKITRFVSIVVVCWILLEVLK